MPAWRWLTVILTPEALSGSRNTHETHVCRYRFPTKANKVKPEQLDPYSKSPDKTPETDCYHKPIKFCRTNKVLFTRRSAINRYFAAIVLAKLLLLERFSAYRQQIASAIAFMAYLVYSFLKDC